VDPFGGAQARSSALQRAGAMTISFLNLTFLPAAQLSFAALACTDTREGGQQQSCLNMLPFVACDAAWRSAVLQPALLSSLLSLIPLVQFALLYRVQQRRKNQQQRNQASRGFDDALRSVLASVTQGYQERVSWWEGVLSCLAAYLACRIPPASSRTLVMRIVSLLFNVQACSS
jgi:hypothetical protein